MFANFNLNQLGNFMAASLLRRLAATLAVNQSLHAEILSSAMGGSVCATQAWPGRFNAFAKPFLKRTPGKLRAVQNACRDIRGAGDFRSMAGAAGLLAWFRSGFRDRRWRGREPQAGCVST